MGSNKTPQLLLANFGKMQRDTAHETGIRAHPSITVPPTTTVKEGQGRAGRKGSKYCLYLQ